MNLSNVSIVRRIGVIIAVSASLTTYAFGQNAASFNEDTPPQESQSGATRDTALYTYAARTRLSATFDAGLGFHNASFQALPEAPSCCSGYSSESGSWLGGALGMERRISGAWWAGIDVGVSGTSVLFSSNQSTTFIINDEPTPGSFRFEQKVNLTYLTIMPKAVVDIVGPFRGTIGIGPAITIGTHQTQKETITQPNSGVIFTSGSSTRNASDGSITSAESLRWLASIGVSAQFHIDRDHVWSLQPQLGWTAMLGRPIDVDKWFLHTARFSLSLLWAFDKAPYRTSSSLFSW